MREAALCLLGVVVCGGLFTAFYRLALHRRTSFRTARIFLVASAFAAACIPAFDIPVWKPGVIEIPAAGIEIAVYPDAPAAGAETGSRADYRLAALLAVYVVGVAGMLAAVARQLAKIGGIRRRAQLKRADGYRIAVSEEVGSPFSFFATVYVGRGTPQDELRQIILHETSHIFHRHSAEKMIMEMLKALMWFNPFAWVASRLLNEVHEFEADRDALRGGCTVDEYLPVIFKQAFGYAPEISAGLAGSLTKKRFEMMTSNMKHGRYSWLRAAGALPAAAGMMMLFGFTGRAPEVVITGGETIFAQAPVPDAPPPAPSPGDTLKRTSRVRIERVDADGGRTTAKLTGVISTSGLKDTTHRVLKLDSGGKGKVFVWLENEGRELSSPGGIAADLIESVSVLKDSAQYPEEIRDAMGGREFDGVVIINLKETPEPLKIILEDPSDPDKKARITIRKEALSLSADGISMSDAGGETGLIIMNNIADGGEMILIDDPTEGTIKVQSHVRESKGVLSIARNPFVWLKNERREISQEELSRIPADAVKSLYVIRDGSSYPREIRKAIGSRGFDEVVVVETKR